MWMKKRHKVVFTLLKHPFKWFLRIKYNFKPIKYKLEKKPYLILSNHLGIADPFFVACSFSRPIYYIATADLFSTKYGKIINYLVAPIPYTPTKLYKTTSTFISLASFAIDSSI